MKVIGLFVAENVIIDQRTNKLSLVNVFENLESEGFPLFIPGLNLVLLGERDPADADGIPIHFAVSLGGRALLEAEGRVLFQPGVKRARCILTVGGLVVPEPGTLEFTASISGVPVASTISEVALRSSVAALPQT